MNRHPMLRRAAAALALAALLQACALKDRADAEPGGGRPWVAAWGSAQLALEPLPAASAPAPAWVEPLRDVSLRQVLRITADGEQLRVRVSNLLGRTPLELGAAAVAARDASAAADEQPPAARAETMRALHFAGQAALVLAPGEEAWSDPVDLPVTRQSELLVDLHVRQGVAPATAHPGSRIRSWAAAGMQVGRPNWAAAAPRVALYTSSDLLALRREARTRAIHRVNDIELWRIEPRFLDEVEAAIESSGRRSAQIECLRSEGQIYFTMGGQTISGTLGSGPLGEAL